MHKAPYLADSAYVKRTNKQQENIEESCKIDYRIDFMLNYQLKNILI